MVGDTVGFVDVPSLKGIHYAVQTGIFAGRAIFQALKRGEYFWIDIVRDGIALYELPQHALATPQPLTPADAHTMATAYFEDWLAKVDSALKGAAFFVEQSELKDAAFLLHQAAERAYDCFLLVRTFYFPRSHNIKFLRSLAEDNEPRLIEAWPRSTKQDRRRFELLNGRAAGGVRRWLARGKDETAT